MKTGNILAMALVGVLGLLVGLAGYTFVYARGYSYLLDDPQACINCHVMRDNFNAWAVSSHRDVTCNGCHTPHEPVQKYLVKAENGFSHSFAFTFEDTQVIHIKERSLDVVQENCKSCHASTIATTFLGSGKGEKRCTECHRGVGHAF